ncbi:hypothetical protein [Dictyobacter formicarum]|uniref:Uncharacterized protein n=1 Tax=Dictyobacter formicarum TaxID=2778368 RepID=A0ABQ3VPU7_9CHLR|nr:hypothetical protein [Dictyobacter formicarum]GHO87623.1 hypothetical protein KSZ_56290 [Dictyobacter formicarum]
MQSMTIQSPTQTVTTTRWLKPALLWGVTDQDMTRPYLAEFATDNFLRDFLSMMAGETPLTLNGPQDKDASGVLKLYQPMHQRYYLVLGSLVCRLWGLPDHTVVRKNGESTSFVLRRMINGQEHGWINDGSRKGWQPLLDAHNSPVAVLPDEQRLPLHPVQAQSQAGSDPRTIYYGYVSVSSREKYLDPAANAIADIQQEITNATVGDPRFDEIATRVIGAWRMLYVTNPDQSPGNTLKPEPLSDPELLRQISLYLILDMGDCLQRFLPEVLNALGTDGSSLNGMTERKGLFSELYSIYIANSLPSNANHMITLADALYNLRDKLAVAQGLDDLPDNNYLLNPVYKQDSNQPANRTQIIPSSYLDTSSINNLNLYGAFCRAIKEAGRPINIPPEVKDLLKNDPPGGDIYFLRLLYERGPCYEPIVSEPGASFTFAKPLDPRAPARPIRIELPSIKLKDLRQFKRGVGMQMTPELNDVINRVHTGMLQGSGLLGTGASVAMICSFSLPIITLVAFIVMFLFLLLFNIIFWWLPFIRICFPLPRSK